MMSLDESGMMRFSRQLVGIVCSGISLPSLVGAVLLGVSTLDDEYCPARPRGLSRPMSFVLVIDHLPARVVHLPLVALLELDAVVVVALRGPPGLKLGSPAWASRGPPRVEFVQARLGMHSNPSASLTSFRPIICRGFPGHWISK